MTVLLTVFDDLSAVKASVSDINSATFRNSHKNLRTCHVNYWEAQLESLSVQNKFLDIVTLERQCLLWKRLMCGLTGLPEKQLSLLLWAECDTLPTPMNLARWNIIASSVCSLCCLNQPTTNHIIFNRLFYCS